MSPNSSLSRSMRAGRSGAGNPTRARRCPACGDGALRKTRRTLRHRLRYDGKDVEIVVPDVAMLACSNRECGETFTDDEAAQRLTMETYRQLGLLTPDEIRSNRKKLGYKQQELARLLGLGDNSVSRWETGRYFQSRTMDRLLRLVFGSPHVRGLLAKIGEGSDLGREVARLDVSDQAAPG